MTAFKSQHRRLTIRGRTFRFVSRPGRAAEPHHARLGYPAMWYLVIKGHRCPVFPCSPTLSLLQLDAALRDWAEDNAVGPVERTGSASPAPKIALA